VEARKNNLQNFLSWACLAAFGQGCRNSFELDFKTTFLPFFSGLILNKETSAPPYSTELSEMKLTVKPLQTPASKLDGQTFQVGFDQHY